jgi:hypothetical protein
MSKHTPGPLTVKVAPNGDCAILKFEGKQCIVAECYAAIRNHDEDSREEALANAHLYAAAPDMLGALKASETQLAMSPELQVNGKDGFRKPVGLILDAVRAAIARAEGQDG